MSVEHHSSKKVVRSVASAAHLYAINRIRRMPKHIGTLREREIYCLGLKDGYEAGVKYVRRAK